MSQSPSQMHDPIWVSVSFAKFSHNSSPPGTRNFVWNHISSRNDLDFTVRGARVLNGNGNVHSRLLMKINAGAEELEQQDLCELVQHVQNFDPSSGAETPVQVVVKSPFLAIRYPKFTNVRRIQLKFHNDVDFKKVLNLLRDLGLPFTATMPAPILTSRPSISPSPSLLSDASTSTLPSAPSMPSMASSTSTRVSLATTGSISNPLATEFKVPMRPNSSLSEPEKRATPSPYAIHQILRPGTTSNFSPLPGPNLSQAIMKAPASLYVAQIERELQSHRRTPPDLPAVENVQEDLRHGLLLVHSQSDSQKILVPENSPYASLQLSQSPFFAPRMASLEVRDHVTKSLFDAVNKSSNQHYHRHDQNTFGSTRDNCPSSESAESTKLSMTLTKPSSQDFVKQATSTLGSQEPLAPFHDSGRSPELLIPPKRALPFPIPRSSSISNLPPLPRPTPISRPKSASLVANDGDSTQVVKTTNKRVAQRKSTAAKPAEIAESPPPDTTSKGHAPTSQPTPHDESSPLAAKSSAASSKSSSAASGLQSKATAPRKRAAPARPSSVAKRTKMVDQSTQTDPFSGRDDTTTPQMPRSEENTVLHHQSPTPTPTPAPKQLPDSYLDAIDAFVTKHKARPLPQEIWERPGWAEADVEQRQMLLDNFICENLENIDFLKLCEDMTVSWRRIGLGM